MARIKAEGANTPADLLLTVDGGNLWQSRRNGHPAAAELPGGEGQHPRAVPLLQRCLDRPVAARTDHRLTRRAGQDGELTTYEALADKNWEGRLCLRTSKKVYNQSLTATMIETHGAETEADPQGLGEQPRHRRILPTTTPWSWRSTPASATSASSTPTTSVVCMRRTQLKAKLFWPNQQDRGVRQPVGHRSDEARAESGCCAQAGGVDDQRRGSEHFRGHQYGIPGQPGRETVRRSCGMGRFKADTIPVEVADSARPRRSR